VLAAGLLHDIGILVLSTQEPEYFDHVLGIATRDGRPLPDVEYEQRGVSHAEVGAHLLALWGVPDTVVEAVAYHHRPQAAHAPALDAVAAVAIAEQLAHDHQPEPCPARPAAVAPSYLERIGVGVLPPQWHELAKREAAMIYQ
jgi:putative nucleotidyltransferase with HDIG domain